VPYFGTIENKKMILSEIGEIVHKEWFKTPLIRPELDLYMNDLVIMPDHIHGIIIRRDARPGVSPNVRIKNTFGAQYNNIPSIIRGIKSAVTIKSRRINPDFGWQSGYYDHIIRNKKDYERIVKYIQDNPRKIKGYNRGRQAWRLSIF
jgi:REP element-mobilizing transposase RayT